MRGAEENVEAPRTLSDDSRQQTERSGALNLIPTVIMIGEALFLRSF